jgi:hypothetical protein
MDQVLVARQPYMAFGLRGDRVVEAPTDDVAPPHLRGLRLSNAASVRCVHKGCPGLVAS